MYNRGVEWIVSTTGRLDAFLAGQEGIESRSQVKKLIKEGSVRVNGSKVKKPAQKLHEGDKISATLSDQSSKEVNIDPADLSLDVLYEDDSCIVINKPAGIAVHPGPAMDSGEITILHGIAFLFDQENIAFTPDAVLVHRLDKETTGCLLIAKSSQAHHDLQKQFQDRTVEKKYLAIVHGVPDPSTALIDAPVGRSLINRTKMSILKTSVSKEAKTTYRTLESTDLASLVECDLHTGRTHQVRVHMKSIGHPILGDPTYGSAKSTKLSREYGIEGLCLHSRSLRFRSDEKEVFVEAPLPEKFMSSMKSIGVNY